METEVGIQREDIPSVNVLTEVAEPHLQHLP